MKFIILTLFPESFSSFLSSSIIARAISKKIIDVKIINIRDYTLDKYHRTDTPIVGGGAGLLLKVQPIVDALKANSSPISHKIILSPRGQVYTQNEAIRLSKEKEIVLLCGHYEGIDERVYPYFDETISIGDYILTGGEIPALALIDSISRLIKGVINEDSIKEESFNDELLEYPQYTEPYEFDDKKIPAILYSGNHQAINKYRLKESLRLTKEYRPDLFKNRKFTQEEEKLLQELEENKTPSWEEEAITKGKKFTNKD